VEDVRWIIRILAGQKIAPEELDLALRTHPGIRDVMAFPVRDPALGEDVAAMIVRDDETLSEDAIPKTPNGKPLRSYSTPRYS
jgi:acyl-CoA synthetase (AMP-forming)/AMP-acid ligase II